MSELKPCPFCGGSAELTDNGAKGGSWISLVKCANVVCGVVQYGNKINREQSRISAIEAWNRRTPQPVTPAGGEVGARPAWWLCEVPKGQEDLFNDDEHSVFVPTEHQAQWQAEDGYTVTPLYTHPPVADAALAAIGELIRTQDNRITAAPIFVVEQKRRICGVEDDFAEGNLWYDARACESYDDAGKAERDADREHEGCPPIQWQRGGYVDVWEFVTACFTEQGCKDYIASNGHNLREPRIFAHGSYRNTEWHTVRDHLAALNQRGGG